MQQIGMGFKLWPISMQGVWRRRVRDSMIFCMERFDPESIATWQIMIDLDSELLSDIAAGRTKRTYLSVEVEAIRAQRVRTQAMVEAYKAALAYEAAQTSCPDSNAWS